MRRTVRTGLSKWVAPRWPVTIVGMVLGALIGTLAFAPADDHTVVAVLRVDPPIDANQILSGTQAFPDAQPDYLAGEIAYLTSPGFLGTVQQKLQQTDPPAVTASQNGKTNLLTISATAGSAEAARKMVDAAVTTYTDHIKELTSSRDQSALDAVNSIIPKLEDAQRAAGALPTNPSSELVALYLQRTALEVQIQRAPGVQVVGPMVQSVSDAALPASSLGTIGGALVGGLVALACALAWRSRSGTITSPSQLDDTIGTPALLPVIRLGARDVKAADARSLYAQLPPPRLGEILVIGTSGESGSASAARYIAFAAEEHGKVETVDLVGSVGSADQILSHTGRTAGATSEESTHEEVTTVIDGGSLENSPALVNVMDHAALIVMVIRIGLDTHAAVGALAGAISQRDVPVRVVCTKSPFFKLSRGKSTSTGS